MTSNTVPHNTEPEKPAVSAEEEIKKTDRKPQQPEEKDADPMETVAATAAVVDVVDDIAGDGDSNFTGFIVGLSIAGFVLSYLAIKSNPGNEGVVLGVSIYIIGYVALLAQMLIVYILGACVASLYFNIFEDGKIPYLYIFGGFVVGGTLSWLFSLIPAKVMKIIHMISWVFMFVGPAIMIQSGANITGGLNVMISIIWLILFFIGMSVNYVSKKVGNAIESAIEKKFGNKDSEKGGDIEPIEDSRIAEGIPNPAPVSLSGKAISPSSDAVEDIPIPAPKAELDSPIEDFKEMKAIPLPEPQIKNVETPDKKPKKVCKAMVVLGGIGLLIGSAAAVFYFLFPNPLGDMVENGVLAQPIENNEAEYIRRDIVNHYEQYLEGKEKISHYAYISAIFKLHALLKLDITPSLPVVEKMIKAGANPNDRLSDGRPALFFAIECCNSEAIQTLVNAGADINIRDAEQQTVMHIAAQNDDLHCLEFLISIGAGYNAGDVQAKTPLMVAIEKQNFNAVKRLVEVGADINVLNKQGESPLTLACSVCNQAIIKLLLSKGAHFNIANAGGKQPLMYAVEKGNERDVRALIQAGVDFNERDEAGRPPVFYALRNVPVLQLFIQSGVSARSKDSGKNTLLSYAVSSGNMQTVKYLLTTSAKEDINEPNNNGDTPLGYAVRNKDIQMTKLLIENEASLKHSPPLIAIAAQQNNIEMVEMLIKAGVNPSEPFEQSGKKVSAIDCTTSDEVKSMLKSEGCLESISIAKAVQLLEQHKVLNMNPDDKNSSMNGFFSYDDSFRRMCQEFMDNYNLYISGQNKINDYDFVRQIYMLWEKNRANNLPEECILAFIYEDGYVKTPSEGISALHFASLYGQKKVVKVLVAEQEEVNHSNAHCETPLWMAVSNGQEEIVEILLAARADVNKSKPLLKASASGYTKIVNDLLNAKADVNAKDADGNTALHLAVKNNHEEIVKALLAANADVNATSNYGITPKQIALQRGNYEMSMILMGHEDADREVDISGKSDNDINQVFYDNSHNDEAFSFTSSLSPFEIKDTPKPSPFVIKEDTGKEKNQEYMQLLSPNTTFAGEWTRNRHFGEISLHIEGSKLVENSVHFFGTIYDTRLPEACMNISGRCELSQQDDDKADVNICIYDGSFDPDAPTAEVFEGSDGMFFLQLSKNGKLTGVLKRESWADNSGKAFRINMSLKAAKKQNNTFVIKEDSGKEKNQKYMKLLSPNTTFAGKCTRKRHFGKISLHIKDSKLVENSVHFFGTIYDTRLPEACMDIIGRCELSQQDDDKADVNIRIYDGSFDPDAPTAEVFESSDSMFFLQLSKNGKLTGVLKRESWANNSGKAFRINMSLKAAKKQNNKRRRKKK